MTAPGRTVTATLQKEPGKGKQASDAVTVHLEERIPPTPPRSAP